MSSFCDRCRSLAIIGNVRTYDNKSLDDEVKQRIYDYLEKPTAANWSDISGIHVNNRLLTLWQAVRKVDPTFPATGRRYEAGTGRVVKEWERIPDPDMVLKAIVYARAEGRPSPSDPTHTR
jgi:hypothetical protein